MKVETTSKHTISVREILKSLGITGEIRSCGFNQRKKISDPLDRELTIVVAKNNKVTLKGSMTLKIKKKDGCKK